MKRIVEPIWFYDDHTYEKTPIEKVPLSKLGIFHKLRKAIIYGEEFRTLGSSNRTAVRFISDDIYIVSMSNSRWSSGPRREIDIAVGYKGQIPFMFRSPFVGDPLMDLDEMRKDGWCHPTRSAAYSYVFESVFATRLQDLCICTGRAKTKVGEVKNEKTGRMNAVYASVPVLTYHPDVLAQLHFNERIEFDTEAKDDNNWKRFHAEKKNIPLFEWAWYFRNGVMVPNAPHHDDSIEKMYISEIAK